MAQTKGNNNRNQKRGGEAMKIYKLKKWGKMIIDGEDNFTIVKNNLTALTLDKSITKHRMLITNFHFYGVRNGFINKLKLLYDVVKYINKKDVIIE